MRAAGVFTYGGPDALEQLRLAEPHAGPGQLKEEQTRIGDPLGSVRRTLDLRRTLG